MSERPYDLTVLPDQAVRIAEVATQTGTAVGLSQLGSTIIIHTSEEKVSINAQGKPIGPGPEQEQFSC